MVTPEENNDAGEIKVNRTRRRIYDSPAGEAGIHTEESSEFIHAEKYVPDVPEESIRAIIKKHSLLSMGAGLIPVPVLDLAAISAIQVRMVDQIAKHYGVHFSEVKTKSLVAALAGSILPASLATGTFTSMIKAVPFIGVLVGSVTLPLTAGACTYAIGKVFVQHFESGGTLLDFDAAKMKTYFIEEFHNGKREVRTYTTK